MILDSWGFLQPRARIHAPDRHRTHRFSDIGFIKAPGNDNAMTQRVCIAPTERLPAAWLGTVQQKGFYWILGEEFRSPVNRSAKRLPYAQSRQLIRRLVAMQLRNFDSRGSRNLFDSLGLFIHKDSNLQDVQTTPNLSGFLRGYVARTSRIKVESQSRRPSLYRCDSVLAICYPADLYHHARQLFESSGRVARTHQMFTDQKGLVACILQPCNLRAR